MNKNINHTIKTRTNFKATVKDIKEVERQIAEKGYWQQETEWRISTVMTSTIVPQDKFGKKWFITTVKCEQEVMIPAATIKQAVIFKKAYENFMMKLFFKLGWASLEQKDKS